MEEIQRIAQGGEAADAKECTIKAVKSILDIDLTGEDLKAFETKPGGNQPGGIGSGQRRKRGRLVRPEYRCAGSKVL